MATGQLLTRAAGVQRGTEADNSALSNTQLSYFNFLIYTFQFFAQELSFGFSGGMSYNLFPKNISI